MRTEKQSTNERNGFVVCCMLLFTGALSVADPSGETKAAASLSPETRAAWRMIADESEPFLMGVFLPEARTNQTSAVRVSTIPKRALNQGIGWMKKVLKKEWVVANLEDSLWAVKDFRLWEKRDTTGQVFSQTVGDYIVAEYSTNGLSFHLADDGEGLSIRIDLSGPTALGSDSEKGIRQLVEQFIDLPAKVKPLLRSKIRTKGGLTYGRFALEGLLKGEDMDQTHWWQDLTVCTDGHFFFVWVGEVDADEGPVHPQATPGPPNRF